MSNLSNARAQLEEWEAKKPADYTSKYKDRIDGVMGQLDGMKDFSYDPTRDAAYEQYKNSYTRQAKLANENAQANASAISGGYGSSYGTQAGQSAYQNAMAGLSNATNGLYSQALNQYTQKKSDLQSQLSGYQQAEAQDYEKYDLLIGMEGANLKNMQRICGGDPAGKMHRLLDYTDRPGDVADPWYTGDFEATWRDVSTGCQGLLASIQNKNV